MSYMATNIKVLMQYGTSTEHVFTVNVPGSQREHILSLAQMAITHAMNSRNIDVQGHASHLNDALTKLKTCNRTRNGSQMRSGEVQAHKSLLVTGTVMIPESDSFVVYGPASFLIENTKFQTNIPAVHIASRVPDNYKVTCLLQPQIHHRDSRHFIVYDNLCKKLEDFGIGSRTEKYVYSPPFQSHYLRRTSTTQAHKSAFKNALLSLTNTKHQRTPLFDYVTSLSNNLICISIFA
jgi:hypothetical protein